METHITASLVLEGLHEQVQETEELHYVHVAEGRSGDAGMWGVWPVSQEGGQHVAGIEHHNGLLCLQQLLPGGHAPFQPLLQELE